MKGTYAAEKPQADKMLRSSERFYLPYLPVPFLDCPVGTDRCGPDETSLSQKHEIRKLLTVVENGPFENVLFLITDLRV
ncbi:Peptidyl-Prolyl Cis-Trans Isomerase-Like 3 [Manis pentadactyla]|nr:Peptidyl-Prolyl Cis-Trans Isomerase-Like 3 [Manis pentadactyla]